MFSLNGLLYRMNEVMSVYEKTSTGMRETMKSVLKKTLKEQINSLKIFNEISRNKYQKYKDRKFSYSESY